MVVGLAGIGARSFIMCIEDIIGLYQVIRADGLGDLASFIAGDIALFHRFAVLQRLFDFHIILAYARN